MDPQQQLVPPGVIGELVMIGAGIGRGYSNSDLDEGRFVVLEVEGKTHRAYRTGDYVRYRPRDGELEFFGRIDNQCKVKGVRTELGEIEFMMRTHALVNDAAVILHPKYYPGSRLVAFITARVPMANLVPSNALRDVNNGDIEYSGSSILTEECLKDVRSMLESKLPPQMVPDEIFISENLPLNITYKVDKLELRRRLS